MIHGKKRNFTCVICDDSLSTLSALRRHEKSKHSKFRVRYACPFSRCGKDFARKDHMVNHAKTKHSGVVLSDDYNNEEEFSFMS